MSSTMERVVETTSNTEHGTKVSSPTPENIQPIASSGPAAESSMQESEERYPPTRDAILIVSAVATSMFLVSLVGPSTSTDRKLPY